MEPASGRGLPPFLAAAHYGRKPGSSGKPLSLIGPADCLRLLLHDRTRKPANLVHPTILLIEAASAGQGLAVVRNVSAKMPSRREE